MGLGTRIFDEFLGKKMLTDNRMLDWSNASADDKLKLATIIMKYDNVSVENIVGTGENAFSPFPTIFSKSLSSSVSLKNRNTRIFNK